MQALIDILKSRGKLGGWLLLLLGVGDFLGIAFGKITFSTYVEAGAMAAGGLAIIGIRSALDETTTPK